MEYSPNSLGTHTGAEPLCQLGQVEHHQALDEIRDHCLQDRLHGSILSWDDVLDQLVADLGSQGSLLLLRQLRQGGHHLDDLDDDLTHILWSQLLDGKHVLDVIHLLLNLLDVDLTLVLLEVQGSWGICGSDLNIHTLGFSWDAHLYYVCR